MAFTGVAVYDNFANEIGESVSPIMALISPIETPFLDDVGDGLVPITNKVYSWEEKDMMPDTYSVSSAVASNAGACIGLEVGANAEYLRVGDILRAQNAGNEVCRVVSLGASAATIYVKRAYAGTSANSLAAGQVFDFLGSAMEEGTSPRKQRRIKKVLKSNFVQIFREDIDVSNLANNVVQKIPGMPSQYDEEQIDKAIEVLKQLEKSVLLGRTNGNTIGAADAETTMAGIYNSIATNITSHATYTNSILNSMFAQIDRYTDFSANITKYGLYCGQTLWRRITNNTGATNYKSISEGIGGNAPVGTLFTDFGPIAVRYSRWLPTGTGIAVRKDFIAVKPFAGNSFQHRRYDDGDSAKKGYIEGTYGLEFKQEKAHGRIDGIA